MKSSTYDQLFGGAPKSAAAFATLMTVSPLVIGTRMTQFWLNAATPMTADHNEAALMVTEKVQAMGESLAAMNLAMMKAAGEISLAAMTGHSRHRNDMDTILSAGLQPYTRRVKANRKRLSSG